MTRLGLDDPSVRTAYMATKAAVILLAGGLSWWLAPRFGPRVWLAWGVFSAALVLIALAVLAAARPRRADSGTDSGADTGSGTDTETGTDTGTVTGSGTDTDTGTDTAEGTASAGRPGRAETAEPVVLPVEGFIDLHPFGPEEIPSVVKSYLEAAWEAGFRKVRLIHGKGIGVQRERVRRLLSRHPLVLGYGDAPPERGGWGATVAILRDDPEAAGLERGSSPRPRG